MKKIISVIIFVLIACMVAPAALAAYPQHDSYIYDEVGVLSDEAKEEIKSENDALFVEKGMRVGVCIVDNTGDIPAETYANGVYEEWKLNGVLLLIVKSTSYAYAAPSEALESILTEDRIKSLIGNIKSPENAEEFSAEVAASVKNTVSFIKQNYTEQSQANKSGASKLGKVGKFFKVVAIIVLVVAVLLGIGYVVLIVLERRQARQRRAYLEERRRRMAQSGRGSYYSARSGDPRQQGSRPAGQYQSQGGYPQQNNYAQQGGYARQNAGQARPAQQGVRSAGDRFVYPDSDDGYSAANRGNASAPVRNVRRPVSRGSASDFDREYFSRPDSYDDNNATREFKTDNN